jgi:hypothetical protein
MANAAPDAEALVEAGLALYGQGHLDEALSKWRAALMIEPSLALALEYIKYVEENRPALEATFSQASPSSDSRASSNPENAAASDDSEGSSEPDEPVSEKPSSSELDPEDRTSDVLIAEGLTSASRSEEEAKAEEAKAEEAEAKEAKAEEAKAEETEAKEAKAEEAKAKEAKAAAKAPALSPATGWEEPPTSGGGAKKKSVEQELVIEAQPPGKGTGPIRPLAAPLPAATREVGVDGISDGGVSAQVDVLAEVGWDNLLSGEGPAPLDAVAKAASPSPDLTPRIDIEDLKKQAAATPARPDSGRHAIDDQTRPIDALSQPAQRARRATPLTLQAHGADGVGFAPQEATPHALVPEMPSRVPTAEVESGRSSEPAEPAGSGAGFLGATGFSRASLGELDANDATPGGRETPRVNEPQVAGRPTTRHLTTSSHKALEPEQVFSQDEAELIADDATPASMIKRGHKPPPRQPEVDPGPAAPPAIPIAVPPPVPRGAPRAKRLELKAEEGFVGLDDLLTSDEEQALEAASQAKPRRRGAESRPALGDALGSELSDLSAPSSPARRTGTGSAVGRSSSPGRTGSASVDGGSLEGGSLEGLAREADSFVDSSTRPAPAEGEERLESMLAGARQLFDQGTFEGSLWLCQKILSIEPTEPTAEELQRRNQEVLLRQYERQLVDLDAVPVVQIPQQEIVWHKLDHRAGFLLSRVDGMLCYDDILDISGMERFEACRILAQLVEQGVIGISR